MAMKSALTVAAEIREESDVAVRLVAGMRAESVRFWAEMDRARQTDHGATALGMSRQIARQMRGEPDA